MRRTPMIAGQWILVMTGLRQDASMEVSEWGRADFFSRGKNGGLACRLQRGPASTGPSTKRDLLLIERNRTESAHHLKWLRASITHL